MFNFVRKIGDVVDWQRSKFRANPFVEPWPITKSYGCYPWISQESRLANQHMTCFQVLVSFDVNTLEGPMRYVQLSSRVDNPDLDTVMLILNCHGDVSIESVAIDWNDKFWVVGMYPDLLCSTAAMIFYGGIDVWHMVVYELDS